MEITSSTTLSKQRKTVEILRSDIVFSVKYVVSHKGVQHILLSPTILL